MWEWNDFSKKDLLIESESFTHAGRIRRRPLKVVALVRLSGAGRSAANATPLAYQYGTGLDEERMFDTEAGHILGLRLGGLNVPENVVPMYAHVNRNLFREVERAIESAYTPGQAHGVELTLTYGGAEPRVPTSIAVRLLRNMAFPDGTRYTFSLPALYEHTVMQTPPVTTRIVTTPELMVLFAQAQAKVNEGWTLEAARAECRDWLARRALPPVDQRPYAFLDYVYFELNGNTDLPMNDVGTMRPLFEFSESQRGYIVLANRHKQTGPKLGECWSDAAGDPITTALVQLGADSGIEIDHIIPKSRGGSNAFSNAQVTSRKFNGSKNNTGA